tara:strand:- start:676 stop:963 length:288 start_codon:yes stop_codon:yes gene_type:complete
MYYIQAIATMTNFDQLCQINSNMINIPKARKFFENNYHIIFEKADLHNEVWWFNMALKKGYLDVMLAHRNGCRGVFEFDNFDAWFISSPRKSPNE